MTTISTTHDFLEALRNNPDFQEAARREILTEPLIGLSEEVTEFRTEMDRRTRQIRGHLDSLRGYDVELKMASNLIQQVERRFGLTRVRAIWSSKISIQPPSLAEHFSSEIDRGIDDGLVADRQAGRLLDTDMVIRARRCETTVYVPVEASGFISDTDIRHVRESAQYLRLLYPGAEVIPVVYGYCIARPQGQKAWPDAANDMEQVHVFLDDSTT